MIRLPPRSTQSRSSAASDVYKRQLAALECRQGLLERVPAGGVVAAVERLAGLRDARPVSYTHLRAHETVLDLVCRLLLEKKNPLFNRELYHQNS